MNIIYFSSLLHGYFKVRIKLFVYTEIKLIYIKLIEIISISSKNYLKIILTHLLFLTIVYFYINVNPFQT